MNISGRCSQELTGGLGGIEVSRKICRFEAWHHSQCGLVSEFINLGSSRAGEILEIHAQPPSPISHTQVRSPRLRNSTEDGIHSPNSRFRAVFVVLLGTRWRGRYCFLNWWVLCRKENIFLIVNIHVLMSFKNQWFSMKESMALIPSLDWELETDRNVLSFFLKLISLAVDEI